VFSENSRYRFEHFDRSKSHVAEIADGGWNQIEF
ncbi:MAG: hypothetical protein ACI94C_000906, partial [Sediminicola sp.]